MPLPARAGQGAKALANFWQALDKECDHKTTVQNSWQLKVQIMLFKLEYHPSVFWNHSDHIPAGLGKWSCPAKVLLFLFESVNHQKINPLQPGAVFRFHITSTSLAAEQGKSAYENCSGKISEVNILVVQPR